MGDPILDALEIDDSEFFGVEKKGKGKKNGEEDDSGGYGNYPLNLQERKTEAEIKKINIDNESKLNNLVEKKMVHSILAAIGQSTQINFVNLARIVSPELAAILGIPEQEMKINEFLSDRIGLALENVQKDIKKMNSDKMFE